MRDPLGVRDSGPLARYAPRFVAELLGVGYRPNAAAVQLRLHAHLSHWLEREGIERDPVAPAEGGRLQCHATVSAAAMRGRFIDENCLPSSQSLYPSGSLR